MKFIAMNDYLYHLLCYSYQFISMINLIEFS